MALGQFTPGTAGKNPGRADGSDKWLKRRMGNSVSVRDITSADGAGIITLVTAAVGQYLYVPFWQLQITADATQAAAGALDITLYFEYALGTINLGKIHPYVPAVYAGTGMVDGPFVYDMPRDCYFDSAAPGSNQLLAGSLKVSRSAALTAGTITVTYITGTYSQ